MTTLQEDQEEEEEEEHKDLVSSQVRAIFSHAWRNSNLQKKSWTSFLETIKRVPCIPISTIHGYVTFSLF
jgi:hypothetical protein